MALFYTSAAIWPENNPFLDDHLIYIIALAGVTYVGAGRYVGLGPASPTCSPSDALNPVAPCLSPRPPGVCNVAGPRVRVPSLPLEIWLC
jgi:hypothetical protein